MIPALAIVGSVAVLAAVVCLESVWCQIPRLRPMVSAIEVALMALVWAAVILGIALFSGCHPEPIAEPAADPLEIRPYNRDRDGDGFCGAGQHMIWLDETQQIPAGYIACPFSGGAFLGFDCNDSDPDHAQPLNTGEPGGCGTDPWENS